MTKVARKSQLVGPALALFAIFWLTVAACFPGPPAATPHASLATSQAGEAVSEPTVVLTKPPAPPTPTLAPTSQPAVASTTSVPTITPALPTSTFASPIATPTAAPETAPTDGEQTSSESSVIFGDLALLEERASSYLSEMSEDCRRTWGSGAAAPIWGTRLPSSWWDAWRDWDTAPKSRNFPGTRPRPASTLPALTLPALALPASNRAAWMPTS